MAAATFGSLALLMQWIIAPLTAMFTAMGVGLWFRAGVERGIIVTSPSQLDRAVEAALDRDRRLRDPRDVDDPAGLPLQACGVELAHAPVPVLLCLKG